MYQTEKRHSFPLQRKEIKEQLTVLDRAQRVLKELRDTTG